MRLLNFGELTAVQQVPYSGLCFRCFIMSKSAEDFLKKWVGTYINAEARISAEANATAAECIEHGEREGFSKADLEKAAGGDLIGYLRRKIIEASGE